MMNVLSQRRWSRRRRRRRRRRENKERRSCLLQHVQLPLDSSSTHACTDDHSSAAVLLRDAGGVAGEV
jgi:hypothetical protein